ncbi:MAG: hypothetical protein M1824_002177 [Vezdaea acicularis]|nr:MAG: hypothetical protein M1824_002177 [Vezdaea acicularis]
MRTHGSIPQIPEAFNLVTNQLLGYADQLSALRNSFPGAAKKCPGYKPAQKAFTKLIRRYAIEVMAWRRVNITGNKVEDAARAKQKAIERLASALEALVDIERYNSKLPSLALGQVVDPDDFATVIPPPLAGSSTSGLFVSPSAAGSSSQLPVGRQRSSPAGAPPARKGFSAFLGSSRDAAMELSSGGLSTDSESSLEGVEDLPESEEEGVAVEVGRKGRKGSVVEAAGKGKTKAKGLSKSKELVSDSTSSLEGAVPIPPGARKRLAALLKGKNKGKGKVKSKGKSKGKGRAAISEEFVFRETDDDAETDHNTAPEGRQGLAAADKDNTRGSKRRRSASPALSDLSAVVFGRQAAARVAKRRRSAPPSPVLTENSPDALEGDDGGSPAWESAEERPLSDGGEVPGDDVEVAEEGEEKGEKDKEDKGVEEEENEEDWEDEGSTEGAAGIEQHPVEEHQRWTTFA